MPSLPYLSDELLTAHLQAADPLADPVCRDLLQHHRQRWPQDGNLLPLIRQLAQEQAGIYRAFVQEVDAEPTGIDHQAFALGQRLFQRTSPIAIAVMVLGVLGRTYAPPSSADVLVGTGRLQSDIVRRLYETADMVHCLLPTGALRTGEKGHEAVLRVRLMHSLVRQRILARGQWTHPCLPINQVEMGLVGLEFIVCLIEGLTKLGFHFSKAERDSYLKLWLRAHQLQGVHPDFLPHTYEEALALYQRLSQFLWRPNANGQKLMANLLRGLDRLPPFYLPKAALETLSVFLMEPELARDLQLRSHRSWRFLLSCAITVNRIFERRHRLWPKCLVWESRWGQHYFDRVLSEGLGKKAVDYLA